MYVDENMLQKRILEDSAKFDYIEVWSLGARVKSSLAKYRTHISFEQLNHLARNSLALYQIGMITNYFAIVA